MILGLLLVSVALTAWFTFEGLRNRHRYDVTRDYGFPFEPDARIACRIENGRLQLEGHSLGELSGFSLLLAVRLETRILGRIRDPYVVVSTPEGAEARQYFERGAHGLRFVDISALAGCGGAQFRGVYCQCASESELLAFRNVDLNGPILILAPHPDDAELAAFGLYSRHPDQVTVVTVSSGETLREVGRQYISGLDSELADAIRRKGLTRAMDALSAPAWGGVRAEAVVVLGYFNETLTAMERSPGHVVQNPMDSGLRPGFFRRFNRVAFASDSSGENRWETLVADLAEIVCRVRPQAVVLPHPQWDPHPDHSAATRAMEAALAMVSHSPANTLYYMTHIRGTAEHPFGPPHCTAGPPPLFEDGRIPMGYLSLPLSMDVQRNKVSALETMHDLRSARRWEKRVKKWAQRVVAARNWPEYGEHAYFRTAVKRNEIFYVKKSAGI